MDRSYVNSFLERNGFFLVEENSYANSKCNVIITSDNYEVANHEGDVTYSNDLNIYWLIGFLTYYNFIEIPKI